MSKVTIVYRKTINLGKIAIYGSGVHAGPYILLFSCESRIHSISSEVASASKSMILDESCSSNP